MMRTMVKKLRFHFLKSQIVVLITTSALRLLVASPLQVLPTQQPLRGCCVCARHFVPREIRFTAIFSKFHYKLERVAIYIVII